MILQTVSTMLTSVVFCSENKRYGKTKEEWKQRGDQDGVGETFSRKNLGMVI